VFGFPNQKEQKTDAEIRIPWVGGIIVTRSLDTPVVGVKDLISENEQRIRSGMVAYGSLEKLRSGDKSEQNMFRFDLNKENLGYGLLLKRYAPRVVDATDAQIKQAALDTIPNVAAMFWAFRIMVGVGFYLLALIAISFYFCAKRVFDQKRWLLKLLVISLPVPWMAALDYRRGAAHLSFDINPGYRRCHRQYGHHDRPIHGFSDCRDVLDDKICTAGAEQPAYRKVSF
jgi:cytochrome d ubiquinol oxidase subunit I